MCALIWRSDFMLSRHLSCVAYFQMLLQSVGRFHTVQKHCNCKITKYGKVFYPKKLFLSEISSGMFIPDPELGFYPPRIQGQKGTGSRIRIRNTVR